ncbi:resuscitation-promoting factor [Actinotalea sp. K2]|uniref:transglycosylase family protein n=1 Tax=Actinotalea sp. K2 TaxID=2939438 RepID=UPI0020174866|nr:resuscitation-promoting factor [Actinotalea sp. K2]MCL3861267.1 transglycosylase family protein [Actinotalea sp. K2]
MPGQPDVWNHVNPLHSLRRAVARPSAPTAATAPEAGADGLPARSPRGRALRVGILSTALVLVAGGAFAVANAHKTISLDLNGEVVEVTTFAGSVRGLLEENEIELLERDLVTPATAEVLRDGDDVVVRHAREVIVATEDGEDRVWTTSLSAGEVLAGLETRGQDARLVASRSAGRADLNVVLDLDGPVDVVADDRTQTVADGSAGLEEVLASLDVTVGDLDRVHVERTGEDRPRVTVVVQRVVAEERTDLAEVPFESVTQESADHFVGNRATLVDGVPGERTIVHRVILVDGAEESRLLLSDTLTREPVTHVERVGTKKRPVAPAPRAAAPQAAASGGAAVGGDVWAALAQCESGGNPTIVSASGTYHGLYQFSVATWQSVGGAGLPSQASADEQTQRAQALQARSGWGQWPHCSSKLGLR